MYHANVIYNHLLHVSNVQKAEGTGIIYKADILQARMPGMYNVLSGTAILRADDELYAQEDLLREDLDSTNNSAKMIGGSFSDRVPSDACIAISVSRLEFR